MEKHREYRIISSVDMDDGSVMIYFGFVEFLINFVFCRKHMLKCTVTWRAKRCSQEVMELNAG